jgi:hypothetical protein
VRVAYPYPCRQMRHLEKSFRRLVSYLPSNSSRIQRDSELMRDREMPRICKVLWSKFKRIP